MLCAVKASCRRRYAQLDMLFRHKQQEAYLFLNVSCVIISLPNLGVMNKNQGSRSSRVSESIIVIFVYVTLIPVFGGMRTLFKTKQPTLMNLEISGKVMPPKSLKGDTNVMSRIDVAMELNGKYAFTLQF